MRAATCSTNSRQRFGYAFEQSDFYRPIVEAREIGEEVRFGTARTRFVDQPHGGPTSLGMRFDEGGYSVAYAVDFSDLTDEWRRFMKTSTCGSPIA